MSRKKFNFVISMVLLFSDLAFAEDLSEFLNTNADDRIYEVLSTDQIDHDYQHNDFLRIMPVGNGNSQFSPSCDPKQFENQILKEKLSTKQYFQKINRYFKCCQNELNRNAFLRRLGLLQFSKVIYPFLSHPQVSRFLVKLSNGSKIPDILALKRDSRPRPLIILKCGFFCSAAQTAYWIPITDLKDLSARIPRNGAEAQSMTREFNAKVEFLSNGKSLKATNSKDFYITWRPHFG